VRTEQLLREVLHSAADQSRSPEAVLSRISAQLARRPRRRRRRMIVAVVAAVLVALAIAVPGYLVNRRAMPADQRVPGNWNLIHRVDLPPGWEVKHQSISADSESSVVGPVSGGEEETRNCQVIVFGSGRFDPTAQVPNGTRVTINGHPGFYSRDQIPGFFSGVTWEYRPGAYALVSCGDLPLARHVAMAERVRFEPVPVRLPFRLRSVPKGYQVRFVESPVRTSAETSLGAVQFVSATGSAAQPAFAVAVMPGTTEIPPAVPGWETETVAGRPAVLSARDAKLCLNTGSSTACIQATEGEPEDLTKSLWAAGRRELLLDVAKRLVLADDIDDTSTWFPANRALPS
jgi:hypothetical protein